MGGAAWPPASPYHWENGWWTGDGVPANGSVQLVIAMGWRFDSPVNGGGTLVLQGMDFDVDPACPWDTIQITKPDGAVFQRTIPRTTRTGTITATQLGNLVRVGAPESAGTNGLFTFTDVGSITAFASGG